MIAGACRLRAKAPARSMSPPRVYHPGPIQVGRDATLEQSAAHHLARVLRLRVGDAVTLFDGAGGEYRAQLRTLERDCVRVRVEAHDAIERESALRVGLAQVISAGELMDLTVQKAVELGAVWIQPLLARRGKVRLDAERAPKRVQHWQRIAVAACEQCGRNRVPHIAPVRDLPEWLGARAGPGRAILLRPDADLRLSQAGPVQGDVTLLAGAESGFAEEELGIIERAGFVAVSLGPRILRTETAGLAALAAMQALWGDS